MNRIRLSIAAAITLSMALCAQNAAAQGPPMDPKGGVPAAPMTIPPGVPGTLPAPMVPAAPMMPAPAPKTEIRALVVGKDGFKNDKRLTLATHPEYGETRLFPGSIVGKSDGGWKVKGLTTKVGNKVIPLTASSYPEGYKFEGDTPIMVPGDINHLPENTNSAPGSLIVYLAVVEPPTEVIGQTRYPVGTSPDKISEDDKLFELRKNSALLEKKADVEAVAKALMGKASKDEIAEKADMKAVTSALSGKADAGALEALAVRITAVENENKVLKADNKDLKDTVYGSSEKTGLVTLVTKQGENITSIASKLEQMGSKLESLSTPPPPQYIYVATTTTTTVYSGWEYTYSPCVVDGYSYTHRRHIRR